MNSRCIGAVLVWEALRSMVSPERQWHGDDGLLDQLLKPAPSAVLASGGRAPIGPRQWITGELPYQRTGRGWTTATPSFVRWTAYSVPGIPVAFSFDRQKRPVSNASAIPCQPSTGALLEVANDSETTPLPELRQSPYFRPEAVAPLAKVGGTFTRSLPRQALARPAARTPDRGRTAGHLVPKVHGHEP